MSKTPTPQQVSSEDAERWAKDYVESCTEPENDDIDLFPFQPIGHDPTGVVRFRENRIISKLVEVARAHDYSLNEVGTDLARGKFTDAEMIQLMQLIGYSVSGYGELTYVQRHATKALEPVDETAASLPPYEVVERLGTLADDDA